MKKITMLGENGLTEVTLAVTQAQPHYVPSEGYFSSYLK